MYNTPEPQPVDACRGSASRGVHASRSAMSYRTDLTSVGEARDRLPQAIRQGIVAMVRVTRNETPVQLLLGLRA